MRKTNVNSSEKQNRIACTNERPRRRKNQRHCKSVRFVGDIVKSVTNYRSNGKVCKRLMKNQLQRRVADNSQISVSIGKPHEQTQSISDVETAEGVMKLLRNKGVLPVLRCVNERTGEHQIGIPKQKKYLKYNRNSQKSIKCMNEIISIFMNNVNSLMFQEQVIVEDLVLSIPTNSDWTSLSGANKFCNQTIQYIDNNDIDDCSIQQKQPLLNDDSKYHWL